MLHHHKCARSSTLSTKTAWGDCAISRALLSTTVRCAGGRALQHFHIGTVVAIVGIMSSYDCTAIQQDFIHWVRPLVKLAWYFQLHCFSWDSFPSLPAEFVKFLVGLQSKYQPGLVLFSFQNLTRLGRSRICCLQLQVHVSWNDTLGHTTRYSISVADSTFWPTVSQDNLIFIQTHSPFTFYFSFLSLG